MFFLKIYIYIYIYIYISHQLWSFTWGRRCVTGDDMFLTKGLVLPLYVNFLVLDKSKVFFFYISRIFTDIMSLWTFPWGFTFSSGPLTACRLRFIFYISVSALRGNNILLYRESKCYVPIIAKLNSANILNTQPCRLGLYNTWTVSLQRSKTPPKEFPGYNIKQSDGDVEYPCIAIAPRSTLARGGITWIEEYL